MRLQLMKRVLFIWPMFCFIYLSEPIAWRVSSASSAFTWFHGPIVLLSALEFSRIIHKNAVLSIKNYILEILSIFAYIVPKKQIDQRRLKYI